MLQKLFLIAIIDFIVHFEGKTYHQVIEPLPINSARLVLLKEYRHYFSKEITQEESGITLNEWTTRQVLRC